MTDPTIYGREESGLVPDGGFTGGVRVDTNKYGPLGDPHYATIHPGENLMCHLAWLQSVEDY